MKKLLIIHNKYQNIGGEDIAVLNEINFLKKHYKVETIIFENNISNKFQQIFSFISNSNKLSNNIITSKINEFKPEIIYLHNTWFKVSLGIFGILEKLNIPIFLKVHNFRYFCTKHFLNSKHFENSSFCPGCGNFYKKKLINRYYKESFLKSLLILRYGIEYFKILKNNNIKILVLTEFHKKFMKNLGIDSNKINVFPNYTPDKFDISKSPKEYIIYAGRISEEKGIENVISSFLNAGVDNIKLFVAGDGPTKNSLQKKYQSENIKFLGQLENIEVVNLIAESLAVVTGTKLFEGQPTFLCEASMMSVPSFFPRTGGIGEFFPKETTLSFENRNYDELTEKFKLLNDKALLKNEGLRNKKYINKFLDEKKLLDTFSKIIQGINND